jgi:PilZ domain
MAQKRRYRRFSLRYPVKVKFDLGESISELRAISNNISLGGVLLEADSSIPQHCDVSFTMTVRGHHIIGPTQIVGDGEVVRVEPHSSGAGFAIAVECKRPISELQVYLPASASQEPSKTRNGRIPMPYPIRGDLN